MEKVRQNEPKLGAVIAVVSQWEDGHDKRVTTVDLINYAIGKIDEGYSVSYSKPGDSNIASSRAAFMYKTPKRYLTVSVSRLVAGILISRAAILVRGVVAPAMDGKVAADGTILELRESLP
jgi:hypothetical protein